MGNIKKLQQKNDSIFLYKCDNNQEPTTTTTSTTTEDLPPIGGGSLVDADSACTSFPTTYGETSTTLHAPDLNRVNSHHRKKQTKNKSHFFFFSFCTFPFSCASCVNTSRLDEHLFLYKMCVCQWIIILIIFGSKTRNVFFFSFEQTV